MKTIGIIAEFNPLHNGHIHLINTAKKITGADRVIIVMSGNYIERGGPAFLDKFIRTKTVLNNNADLVIELPVCYAMSSANYFATGAISILNSMSCVDYLCFGCETTNLNLLNAIADIIIKEPDEYKQILKNSLSSGMSFVKSREVAIKKTLCKNKTNSLKFSDTELSSIIAMPNSILAIEYIIALKRLNSSIKPYPIKRNDSGYHSLDMTGNNASASAIRKDFNINNNNITKFIPQNSFELLKKNFNVSYPIYSNDFSSVAALSLNDMINHTQSTEIKLENIFDLNTDISNRFEKYIDDFTDVESFVSLCNSRTYTGSRILRGIFNCIFKYTKEDYNYFISEGSVFYYRVLGFNKDASDLLTLIKSHSSLPLITKLSQADKLITSKAGKRMLELNNFADEIYRLTIQTKYKLKHPTDYQQGVIVKSSDINF